ncbi:hypothetical protein CDL12_29633 [Handroanthus impetiginosus]|uniref:Uncharacterized protein n=1 Tax=Handroanthus impetiginosus TaxID=429701 RepID=A0A2G9FYD1_9LAMI|nr:hypothetical protein CDL12_29633 [Handroanthus impetiginosus]
MVVNYKLISIKKYKPLDIKSNIKINKVKTWHEKYPIPFTINRTGKMKANDNENKVNQLHDHIPEQTLSC